MTAGASSSRARVARAVEAHRSAAEAVGPITPGMALFLVTRGQFSMIDLVQHVLREVGPASVSVWTWAIADYEVEVMTGLMASASITSGRLIVDRSAERRSVGTIDGWRARFGVDAVRVCKTHAKIARVWNERFKVLLRGSMNLNCNPRFEQADITEGGPDFDLVERLESELPVLARLCSNADAEKASRLSLAFEAGEMAMFSGVKPWRP
jgi:hypothetical protein